MSIASIPQEQTLSGSPAYDRYCDRECRSVALSVLVTLHEPKYSGQIDSTTFLDLNLRNDRIITEVTAVRGVLKPFRKFCLGVASVLSLAHVGIIVTRSQQEHEIKALANVIIQKRVDLAQPLTVDIPYVDGVAVDGRDSEWKRRGFHVASFHGIPAEVGTGNFRGDARIAWSRDGLLVYVKCFDGMVDNQVPRKFLNAREITLHVGTSETSGPGYDVSVRFPRSSDQQILASGNGSKSLELRKASRIAAISIPGGYAIEALLPLTPLNLQCKEATRLRMNIDLSRIGSRGNKSLQLWAPLPKDNAWLQPILRLSSQSSPPVLASVTATLAHRPGGRPEDSSTADAISQKDVVSTALARMYRRMYCKVSIQPIKEHIGKEIVVRAPSGTLLARTRMRNDSPTILDVPGPGTGELFPFLSILIDETPVAKVVPHEPLTIKRSDYAGITTKISFPRYIFEGEALPAPQIVDPVASKCSLGSYALSTRYYDAKMDPTTSASQPGRYGAITTLHTSKGDAYVVYTTLMRRSPSKSATVNPSGARIPRVSEEERLAIEALYRMEVKTSNSIPQGGYQAFDQSQAWWLKLRAKLGITYPCVVTLPTGYQDSPSKRWPVIIYFHGGGAQDLSDLKVNLLKDEFTKVVQGGEGPFASNLPSTRDSKPSNLPFLVIEPELSLGDLRWTGSVVSAVIDQAKQRYRIDPERVILTGYSSGANGAWRVALSSPEMFAAFVPISASFQNVEQAYRLKNLPTWLLHGADDNTASPTSSMAMASAINEAGGHARLTIVPGVNHDTAVKVWQRKDIWEWMLKQRRYTAKVYR